MIVRGKSQLMALLAVCGIFVGCPAVFVGAQENTKLVEVHSDATRRVCAISADCRTYLTADNRNGYELRDIGQNRVLQRWVFSRKPSAVHLNTSGDRLAVEYTSFFEIYETASGKSLGRIDKEGVVRAFAFCETHGIAYCGNHIWDLSTFRPLHSLASGRGGITALAFSARGKYLAASSLDHTLRVWQLPKHDLVCEIVFELKRGQLPVPGELKNLSFSADEQCLVVGDTNRIAVWNLSTAKQIRQLDLDSRCATISPDGRLLASAPRAGNIRIVDLFSGKRVAEFPTGEYRFESLRFMNDNRWLFLLTERGQLLKADIVRAKFTAVAGNLDDFWHGLKGDPATAFAVAANLALTGDKACALLRPHLAAREAPAKFLVQRLIDELGSQSFRVRQLAQRELLKLDYQAVPFLSAEMESSASLEKKRRIAAILESLNQYALAGEQLAVLRSIQTLEWIGSQMAVRLMEEVAKGDPHAIETKAAAQAMLRWKATQSRRMQ